MADRNEIPLYPLKLSRDERRAEKERTKLFGQELKSQAKGSGWRFARGTLFKQESDWFVSNMPTLAYERGVINRWSIKPMAIDPLFWEIVGLEENNNQPLSFRDSGAWTIRPTFQQTYTSADTENPKCLAADVLEWSGSKLENITHSSLEQMLAELEPIAETHGMNRTIAVCLLSLLERYEEALSLCGVQDGTPGIINRDSGGFVYGNETFFDGARKWIQAKIKGS